jgi:carbonic anhydrase
MSVHRTLIPLAMAITVTALFASPTADTVSPEDALGKLQGGNARFATSRYSSGQPVAARRAETAAGQHPFAIIVGCADSRTAPELIFDRNLGDLFVVRTAGNLVDEHALGSIEYAVEHLGARLVVVLGHERCGAVSAAVAGATAPGHIQSLVRDIQPAVKAVQGRAGDPVDNAVRENAVHVASRIREEAHFGDLAKQVRVISAVYDLDTGIVEWPKD